MSNKDAMICDIETGICGPAREDNSAIELIDLTSLSLKDSNSVTEQTEEDNK